MFDVSSNLLGAMTLQEKLLDAVTVTIVGMGIVFLALILMGEAFKLLGNWLIREPVPEPESSPAPKAQASSGPDPKLIAVLTAAAMAATGKRVIVRRVTFINHNTVSGWAEAGRLGIHTSHNIRRNV